MLPKPYVGITGITNEDELDNVLTMAAEAGFGPDKPHTIMTGFLASSATAMRQPVANARHVPDARTLYKLAERAEANALTVMHYEVGEDAKVFALMVHRILGADRLKSIRGMQINGTPDVDSVRKIKRSFPFLKLIYQIRPELLAQGGDVIAQEIAAHRGAFNYVLIDPSCGKGVDIDVDQGAGLHDQLRTSLPDVGIVFAGGFSGENAESRVKRLVRATGTKNISIDAEGKLRDANDQLYIPGARQFLTKTAAGFADADSISQQEA